MKSRILYIDDEMENLESFKMTFWNLYEIDLANSTKEAEELIRKKHFELVISDQKMANETGLEFIERIKSNYPLTLFILLTAYSDMDVVIKAINLGVDRYIQKPWDYNELKHAIDNALEKYKLRKNNSELLAALQESNFQLKHSNNVLIRHSEELKEKQTELDKSEKLLTAIYRNLPLIVFLIDENCRIIKINRAGKLVAGKPEHELVGKQCGEALNCVYSLDSFGRCGFADECLTCIIKNKVNDSLSDKADNYKVEGHLRLKQNGVFRDLSIFLSATYLKHEHPMLILSLEDITKQKAGERKLQKQFAKMEALNERLASAMIKSKESDRMKSAILSNISHEIRTPLHGIIGYTEMVLNTDLSEKKKAIFFDAIRDSSNKLLRVVNDLLEISSIESDKVEIVMESFSLNQLITEMFFKYNKQANKKGIDLLIYKPDTDTECTIMSDRLHLVQILDSLIENGLKFTYRGSVKFGYKFEQEQLILFVKDTGIGIAEEMHHKIFESFFQVEMDSTRTFSGVGLGLSITKKLIELLGGHIWLESVPQKGTTFYFTLSYKKR